MKNFITIIAIILPFFSIGQPVMVKDIYSGTKGSGPNRLTPLNNNKFVFTANDSIGNSLYVSDGTSAGTNKIVSTKGNSWIGSLGNKVIFDNDPLGGNNLEPYVTDGTTNGTQLLVEIVPGFNGSYTKYIGTIGATAFIHSAYGIYKTNGLPSGTTKMFQVQSFDKWIIFKNKVYFWGKNNFIEGLWSFDENSTQPTLVNKSVNFSVDFGVTVGNNLFYYIAQDSIHGIEPWVSDGTVTGTHILKDIYPGITSSCQTISSTYNTTFAMINDKVYFNPTEPINGRELWVSDGTELGTLLFKDIKSGTQSGNPRRLMSAGNKFYFSSGFTASTTDYVGVSDGTPLGTVELIDSTGNPYELIDKIYKFNNKIVFNSRKLNGVEPYVSDGTTSGTFMMGDIDATNFGGGIDGGVGYNTIVMGDAFYFSIDDGVHGSELWKFAENNNQNGIDKINKNDHYTIYPNPTTNELNILSNIPIEKVEIYNLSGQLLLISKNTKVDVSELKEAIYFLKIFSENSVVTYKFIKQ